eukprot:1903781-Pyramimonas_sp.AAC.1
MTQSWKLDSEAGSPNLHPGPSTPTSPEPTVVYGAGLARRVTGQALERGGLPQPAGPRILERNRSAHTKAASSHPKTET